MVRIITTLKEKWPEYLIEAVVIMGSILAAIELENWNESRKEKKFEIKILKEISTGLGEDLLDLEFNIEIHNQALKSQEHIVEWVKSKTYKDDSICYDFGRSSYWTVFISNNGSYETLKNYGLGLVKDDPIRERLTELYEIDYDFHDELENYYNSFLQNKWHSIDPSLFKNTFLDSDSPIRFANCQEPIDEEKLRNSAEFFFYTETLIETNKIFIEQMTRSQNGVENLKLLIDEYVKENQ